MFENQSNKIVNVNKKFAINVSHKNAIAKNVDPEWSHQLTFIQMHLQTSINRSEYGYYFLFNSIQSYLDHDRVIKKSCVYG